MLRELRLRDFRCFEHLVFAPSTGLNFLVGANAQGKTSILEAACVLLRLQSPKASSLGETLRFEQSAFSLDGHWNDRHLRLKFERGLKNFALDSKPQSRSADYLAVARVAWIGNDDLQLVRGSGSARRRYLDFLGSQSIPGYLRALRSYERALRSRNALIKDNRPRREIEAFDRPLTEAGEFLLDARIQMCADLGPLVAEAYLRISGGREELSLAYIPGCLRPMAEALAVCQAEEGRQRSTVVGPHRDDIEVMLSGRPAAIFASEGQQRSVALALKLGQAEALSRTSAEPPLYLIDDVFGELDPQRRNNLLAALPPAAQKLVTLTSLEWLSEIPDATVFQLAGGVLTPA